MKVLVIIDGSEVEIRDKKRLFSHMPKTMKIDFLWARSLNQATFLNQSGFENFFSRAILVTQAVLYCLVRKYDVVVSFGSLKGILFSFLKRILRLKRPCHVMEESSALPAMAFSKKLTNRLFFSLTRFAVSSSQKIVCYTRYQRDFWNSCFSSCSKAVFVPFGIPSSFLDQQKTENVHGYIFSGGRTGRDFKTLISATRNMAVPLVIACGAQSLMELKDVSLSENVELLFEVPFSKFKQLIADSLFTVLPLKDVSYSTGICVFLTCMIMGKAVIVTKTSTSIDYIRDGKTGLFVQPGNVTDLENKVNYLLENPYEAKRLGENAQATVKECFLEPRMALMYWELMTTACNSK